MCVCVCVYFTQAVKKHDICDVCVCVCVRVHMCICTGIYLCVRITHDMLMYWDQDFNLSTEMIRREN